MLETTAPFLSTYGYFFLTFLLGYFINKIFQQENKPDKAPASNCTVPVIPSPVTPVILESKSGATSGALTGSENVDTDDVTSSATGNELGQVDGEEEEGAEDEEEQHIPFLHTFYTAEEMNQRSYSFYEMMRKRRTLRLFSDKHVPYEVIENLVRTAGTSPSGANMQPWTFVVVSNPDIKSKIRSIIEDEEKINYEKRMSDQWLKDLKVLKTSWQKPQLEIAPYMIIVFKQPYGLSADGKRVTHYYVDTSTSIAVGLLLAAIQNAGLVTATSTPMNAGPRLRELLNRPVNEKVLLLLPVGYPAENATVPDLPKKPLYEIMFPIK